MDAQTAGTGFRELPRAPGATGDEESAGSWAKIRPQLGFPRHALILGLASPDLSDPWFLYQLHENKTSHQTWQCRRLSKGTSRGVQPTTV